jgi:alcohol dehydrogenase (cytochrome c)
MSSIRWPVLVTALTGGVWFPDAVAQSGVTPGIYTAAQAQRGREAYALRCADCHGPNLEGAGAPALAGPAFRKVWGRPNRTIDDLFYIVRTTMPRPSSGSLSTDQYLDLLAYLLQQNGLPAGAEPLVASPRLASLRIEQKSDSGTAIRIKRVFIAGERTRPRGRGPTQAELDAAPTSTDWLYHTHNYSGTRYSNLSEINTTNANRLSLVCTYRLGDPSFFQAGPIVWRGVMYLSNIRVTAAIDAATCRELWRHRWLAEDSELWPNNRGVAIKDGYVVRGTADGYLLALDSEDGTLLWARQVARPAAGETITMPPLIWEDRVFIGPAGSENNIRGWIGAFRLSDGEPLWRFNAIPTAGEPGAETWGNPKVPVGGGAIWTPLALDQVKGELYVAVTNPAPDFPSQLRPGKNLYTNSVVALDVRTGRLRWYQQLVPSDFHDWDLTQVSPLFRTIAGGRERNVMSTIGKDGILRLLDRETQDRLWETPITTQLNVDTPFTTSAMVRFCPGSLGGVQWNGPAWDPASGLLIVPTVDWCASGQLADTVRLIPGQIYLGGQATMDSAGRQGWLTAVDARDGQVKWRYRSREPMVAAVTTSAGGLVLTGETTGDFLVLEAETGKELYRFNTGGPIGGGLVTYAVEGRQYVAVTSGRPSIYFGPTGSPSVVVFALPSP